jgi:peptidyl-prolyl cis-trans isomerase B (cyclophilin B)
VLTPGESAAATVETSCGSFVIELDTKGSPKTANSFAFLAEEGLYDHTWFHRIVTDAFIQGGDPLGDGTGGPGYTIQERVPADTSYLRGIVAMAKTAVEPPGTSGSQFFVVAQADAGLSADYAVLGQVVDGIDVVARIAALGDPASGQEGASTEPVAIDRVTIETG